jgi:hypothetical protein
MLDQPSPLARFQADFAALFTGRTETDDSALARAAAIHRNTAAKAAQDALAANYPVVQALFGDEAFAACSAGYVALSPPRDPRLNAYGEGLDAFLRAYAPAMDAPYMADVAALERLATEALFAADAAPLDASRLATGIEPGLRLALHPAARFAAFDTPALSIWHAHRAGDEAALETLDWRPEAALVTRPQARVEVVLIDLGAVAFLQACARGEPVAAAAAGAAQAGADLQAMFQTLITAGAFADGMDGDLR